MDLADHYDFLIVGGGMAADAAARGIRDQGADGTIGVLGEEPTAPFPRPALSKKLWTDPEFTVENTALSTAEDTSAEIHLATRVVEVDADGHRVRLADGTSIGYGRLLVATGGRPRRLPDLPAGDRVIYFRSLSDYRSLRAHADAHPHVAVVGGGYIGSEIAAALSGEGCRVTLLHPDRLLGQGMFPDEVAQRFETRFTDAGVEVRGGHEVTGGQESAESVRLDLDDGSTLTVDVVVVGLGVEPATDLLQGVAELAEDGGVVVDSRLRTSAPDVWAAGDIATYPDAVLGRTRVEHVDNATTMGEAAGRLLAGSEEPYDHTPMFYSDVLGLGYQGMGTLDPSLQTYVDVVDAEAGTAVVYYLDDDQVRGVLLWDLEDGLDEARELLARHDRPADPAELAGTIGR